MRPLARKTATKGLFKAGKKIAKEFGNDMFSGVVFSGMEFGVFKITKSIFERGFGR